MELPLNRNRPTIMHIDLNSCFATVEQQANPLLRGKPLAVAAYDSPNGCIVSPSIEAKRYGIKTGMPVREGRLLCPELIVRTPDPEKYRDVHLKFGRLFREYSPNSAGCSGSIRRT
jgi:DNA polymerase-4